MTQAKFFRRAPAALLLAVLSLAVAGCGRSAKEEMAASYCPIPFTVQDAVSLTRFGPGPGRDPRDIVFEAGLGDATSECALGKNLMTLTLRVTVAASAGPAVGAGAVSVPYFVRVIDGSGQIVQGREFGATFKLSASKPRGASVEELTLRLPFDKPADVSYYRIAVGLKPTQEELEYNRRSAGR
jgi:hypothetical protein